MARTKKTLPLVAEICLYGTSKVGFAYIGTTHDGRKIVAGWKEDLSLPTGTPANAPGGFDSATGAVFDACATLDAMIPEDGLVRLFDAGGKRYVDFDLHHPRPYGSLTGWVVVEGV